LVSGNSAAVIMNAANYYGDEGLYDEYSRILVDRETAEGLDLDLETEG